MASAASVSAPLTLVVSRRIAPERYGDFLEWLRQGNILAAGFPGFLGAGVLQPPEGGDHYQIVLRFLDRASFRRYETSVARQMWLERGACLVKESHLNLVSGMDEGFAQPAPSVPGKQERRAGLWVMAGPALLLIGLLFDNGLAALPLPWRVLLTSAALLPLLGHACRPALSRRLAPAAKKFAA
jgi:antibiotic biosynthesis monooxygenase (ABM) superfamily enzyme